MSKKITISDDGDEVVYVSIIDTEAKEVLFTHELTHEALGWSGMTEGIEAIKKVAAVLEVEVIDTQDIV